MDNSLLQPDMKERSYYRHRRDEMISFIPRNVCRILEIGCAEGEFGLLVKEQHKVEYWGIDISLEAINKARLKIDFSLFGDFENDEVDIPKNYFDCVVFNDVLEHFKYPWIVLRKTLAYLTGDAYVVASIPNVRYYDVVRDLIRFKEWRYTDEGILDKAHLRFFTENSIKDMFSVCGYKMIRINGIHGMGKLPWKLSTLNWITMGAFEDLKFKQFACLAQRNET